QFRERADVARRVDDDLLPLEGGVEVRHHANEPGRDAADTKRLGRGAVLAPLAERALVELRLRRLVREARCLCAGPPPPIRRDNDETPGERVSPKIQSPCCRRARGTC